MRRTTGTRASPFRRRVVVLGLCIGLTAAGSAGNSLLGSPGGDPGAPPSLTPHPIAILRSAAGPAGPQPARLHGRVILAAGAVPEATEVLNTTDPEACGRVQSHRDLVVSEDGRGIRDVIVALNGVPRDAADVEPGRLVLANRDCRFEPHAAVATVGSALETVNEDGVLHTVHLYGAREENLSLPVRRMSRSVVLDTPGMITILCDVHGWMRAYVRVDTHPFHAVTDAAGRFRLPDAPAGTWELEVWHERLGSQRRTVRLDAGSSREIEITYSLD